MPEIQIVDSDFTLKVYAALMMDFSSGRYEVLLLPEEFRSFIQCDKPRGSYDTAQVERLIDALDMLLPRTPDGSPCFAFLVGKSDGGRRVVVELDMLDETVTSAVDFGKLEGYLGEAATRLNCEMFSHTYEDGTFRFSFFWKAADPEPEGPFHSAA